MKKIILLLFILMSVCSTGLAERQTFKQEILQSQAFKGQVDSIILPDPVRGIKHQIIVINSLGKKMIFVLTSGLGVYGPDWEVLNLKKIKPGDKVLVEYTTANKDNFNRAISIMIMPG
ncbi:MAG: hypothetical protein PHS66_03825 [Candidatus Omnitrophica bacterium]|nr:hypothetical protein [Candidatus Omnitrophota bacterium]